MDADLNMASSAIPELARKSPALQASAPNFDHIVPESSPVTTGICKLMYYKTIRYNGSLQENSTLQHFREVVQNNNRKNTLKMHACSR